LVDQLDGRFHGAAGCQQIVHQHHALASESQPVLSPTQPILEHRTQGRP
jgi:hypothetical protein